MMKKAILSVVLVALLVASLVMLSCKHLGMKASQAKELQPCQVAVPIVETIYAGKECVCFSPVFELYNPNEQGIFLSKFTYELDVGDFYFSGQQVPVSLYIPPKGKASFVGALPAAWVGMSLWLMQVKGVSMAQAMKEVVSLWKAWGAKLFNPKLKEAWKKAKAHSPDFVFYGECEISADGVSTRHTYKVTYAVQ